MLSLQYFIGVSRLDDQLGVTLVLAHPVGVVGLNVCFGILGDSVEDSGLVAQQLLEPLDVFGGEFGEFRVSLEIRV
jgi:hypothetical protein